SADWRRPGDRPGRATKPAPGPGAALARARAGRRPRPRRLRPAGAPGHRRPRPAASPFGVPAGGRPRRRLRRRARLLRTQPARPCPPPPGPRDRRPRPAREGARPPCQRRGPALLDAHRRRGERLGAAVHVAGGAGQTPDARPEELISARAGTGPRRLAHAGWARAGGLRPSGTLAESSPCAAVEPDQPTPSSRAAV